MAQSGWPNKKRNLLEMLKGFRKMPNAMAFEANFKLKEYILLGNPINRKTGDLIASWRAIPGDGIARLEQTASMAPYAPRVMGPVSIARINMPALEYLMQIMNPKFEFAIKEEFRHISAVINTGGKYKFDAAAFQMMVRNG